MLKYMTVSIVSDEIHKNSVVYLHLQTAMKPVNIVNTFPAVCRLYGLMTLTMLLAEYCPQNE